MLDFARSLVQTEFPLPLKMDEHITSVHILGEDGSDRALGPSDYRYDPATHTLIVERTVLGAMDAKLRVEITSDCRPIVR